MATDILLSIKPRFANQIVAGTKTVELRRRALRIPCGTIAWIYSTLPSGRIEVVTRIQEVVTGSPRTLWTRFGDYAGVSRQEFFDYYSGLNKGYVLLIGDARAVIKAPDLETIRRVSPRFQPPQFFTWLRTDSPVLMLLLENQRLEREKTIPQ